MYMKAYIYNNHHNHYCKHRLIAKMPLLTYIFSRSYRRTSYGRRHHNHHHCRLLQFCSPCPCKWRVPHDFSLNIAGYSTSSSSLSKRCRTKWAEIWRLWMKNTSNIHNDHPSFMKNLIGFSQNDRNEKTKFQFVLKRKREFLLFFCVIHWIGHCDLFCFIFARFIANQSQKREHV